MSTDEVSGIETNRSLSEIPPTEKNRNEMIANREEIRGLVEAPLVRACEGLYNKNIRTLASSANRKDAEVGYAYLIVDVGTMSQENQEIARLAGEIIDYDGRKAVELKIPLTSEVGEQRIEETSFEFSAKFVKQPMTWAPKYTVQQLKAAYGISEDETCADDPSVWTDEGYYYDGESKTFYLSEEHFKKVNGLL
jgi:hypothetical protein